MNGLDPSTIAAGRSLLADVVDSMDSLGGYWRTVAAEFTEETRRESERRIARALLRNGGRVDQGVATPDVLNGMRGAVTDLRGAMANLKRIGAEVKDLADRIGAELRDRSQTARSGEQAA